MVSKLKSQLDMANGIEYVFFEAKDMASLGLNSIQGFMESNAYFSAVSKDWNSQR